jgi:hypothetical protein
MVLRILFEVIMKVEQEVGGIPTISTNATSTSNGDEDMSIAQQLVLIRSRQAIDVNEASM